MNLLANYVVGIVSKIYDKKSSFPKVDFVCDNNEFTKSMAIDSVLSSMYVYA